MPHFIVTWKINIEADTPEEAVNQSLVIQRDPESVATCFEVVDMDTRIKTSVDLLNNYSPECCDDIYPAILKKQSA